MSESKPLLGSNDDVDLNRRRLKEYQPWVFFVTFGGYFMSHFARKGYSTVKEQFQNDAGFSPLILSAMDTVFMGTYAVGNIVNGKLGDTIHPTYLLAAGLMISGICLLLINIAIWFDFEAINEIFGNCFILAVYFVFGFFQATGGPVGTAVMGNWYCDEESVKNRGTIFGFWTCHQYCGDITAQLCTSLILALKMPYWWALLIPAIANIAWSFLTARLIPDPATSGIITPEVRARRKRQEAEKKQMAEQGKAHNGNDDEGPKPITFAGAFKIPMVLSYAVSFGFLKLINYTLFFWLPYFLENHFSDVEANLIAILYSVGIMPGGIIVGRVSDLFGGRRAVVIATFLLLLIVFLAIFAEKSGEMHPAFLLVVLGIIGILVGGPNNIITSAVAADLASHPSVHGSNKALGTITGLINGCGSITSAIGLMAVGPLQEHFGWESVWFYMIGCAAMSALLMSNRIYEELFPRRTGTEGIVVNS